MKKGSPASKKRSKSPRTSDPNKEIAKRAQKSEILQRKVQKRHEDWTKVTIIRVYKSIAERLKYKAAAIRREITTMSRGEEARMIENGCILFILKMR